MLVLRVTWLMVTLGINGFRGVFSQPLGYVIIRVQVKGVWGYDEDQVALVIPDSTIFGSRVLWVHPSINWIINVIKESEINELLASLNGLWMVQLLVCWQAELLIKGETTMHQTVDPTYFKEAVKMTKKEDIHFFIQNNTWPNENHAPRKQHACNDSGPERR